MIEDPISAPGTPSTSHTPLGAAVLEVTGVRAGYGKKEILHGVTLSVSPGEVVVVLGPNGAGKSTLLKVIAGLVPSTTGRVCFQGLDMTDFPAYRRARAGIAYLIQGAPIFPSLTPRDHLRLGEAAARWGGRGADGNGRHCFLLPSLQGRLDTPAGLCSGGERQALAAAVMLTTKPDLLLADEPSAGLAPAAAQRLLRFLAEASQERGLPVLWVEQRVAEVLPLADRAVLLRAGRVVAETNHPREWLDSDLLSALAFGGDR